MLLAAAAVIVVTASLSPLPEGKGLRFVQVHEGILIAGLPEPPAELALPANELAPLPTPAKADRSEDRWGPADENSSAAFCAAARDAACPAWVEASWRRRRYLAQVLSPRYVLSLGKSSYREVRAAEAIKRLTSEDRVLLPAASPRVEEGRGVVIPWEAMPARSGARMDRVSVEIRERAGGHWQSYLVRLGEPRFFTYGPCNAPFEVDDTNFGPSGRLLRSGFYLPRAELKLDAILAWSDPHPWFWQTPSPRPLLQRATAIAVPGVDYEAWVCGPILSYARRSGEAGVVSARLPGFFMTGRETGFRVAKADASDGRQGLLVLAPPRMQTHSPYGFGGSCAGAAAVGWEVGYVDTHVPSVRLVRSGHQVVQCHPLDTKDYAVDIAEDLQTMVEYLQEGNGRWRSRKLTWTGRAYREGPWRPSGPAPATALPQGRDVR